MGRDSIIDLLKNNIIKLTKIQENNYYTMLDEINKLKKSNFLLEQQNYDLNQKERKRKNDENSGSNMAKKQRTSNDYKFMEYKTHEESYDDNKINKLYSGLNSIEDIINLKNTWRNVRHDKKLQKIHNIIKPLQKLSQMIGLTDIKKELFKVIIYYLQNDYVDEYLHTVIYGPPGVGKTEFAKIYADIFVKLGILDTDNFLEIKRNDLVAKYLGQTSHLTKDILDKGMGGVIFMDEAYSLGNAEKRDSFAKESIDMINLYLSEKKNNFMFIIAGYEDELENCFFSFNKGLKRRFSHYFKIEKYSWLELMEIFKLKLEQKKYKLDISDEDLNNFFKQNYELFTNYGGDIEKLVNYIKYEQSLRCFKSNDKNNIVKMEDLLESIKKFLLNDKEKKEKKEKRPPYGMYT